MQEPWFQKWKWVYVPAAWQGWFVTLIVLLYGIQSIFIVWSLGTSPGQSLYLVAPAIICGFGVLLWIASKTDGSPRS